MASLSGQAASLGSRRELYRGGRFVVARARSSLHGSIVIKTPRSPADAASQAALAHEYAILRQCLDTPGVVRLIGLERLRGEGLALLLEDAGPATLRERLQRPMGLEETFAIAERLAEILGRLHGRGVLHLDIAPRNVVMSAAGEPTLVDFDRAATIGDARSGIAQRLEGALRYLAPEQTGRLDRAVDQRADLYSLGAVLYELLTGAPPFRSEDPLEIVHAHLTRVPVSPSVVAPRVPQVLSDIVLKLLAKPPAARYQSAAALAADLTEARRRWESHGEIEPFELGSLDLVRELPLPERLYGRERELASLRRALDRASAGASELVLVAGEAGVGKSALVRAIRDDVLSRGGRFLSGKFDLRAAHVPFAPLRAALRELCAEITAEPSERRATWRARVAAAVGPNGRALTDVVPELAALLGEQPALTPLDPFEAQVRFHLTLQAFLQVFAAEGAPLALFLDDLQWADVATIDALRAVATDPDSRHLLVLGAFRSREASPLARLLADLERAHATPLRIDLLPLGPEVVQQLLADTLRCEPDEVRPLSDLLVHKTAGNPFFLGQLVRSLQRDGLLSFDVVAKRWRWDIARIEQVGLSDNVVDVLLQAIRRLPGSTRDLLPVAACVGNVFEPAILAAVLDKTVEEVLSDLVPALREGLVLADVPRRDGAFVRHRFAHDRVQQAAHSLLSERRQQEVHQRIGQRRREAAGAQLDEVLFDVADHLNLGASLLATAAEKLDLARLDHAAGLKAKGAAAHASALEYFQAGISVAPDDVWQTDHELALSLHHEAAECAYVSGQYARSDALVDRALSSAASVVEKADLHVVRVISASARAAWADALQHGREALAELGYEILPEHGVAALAEEEQRAVDALFAGRAPDTLLAAPLIERPEERSILRLLVNLQHPAWFQDPAFYRLLALRAMRYVLEHGISPEAVTAVCNYAAACLSPSDRFADAEAFAAVGLALAERLGHPGQLANALLSTASFVRHWTRPYASVLPLVARGFEMARTAGEMRNAAYACSALVAFSFAAGQDLDEVLRVLEEGIAFLRKTRNEAMIAFHARYRQAIRTLQGLTHARNAFDEDRLDETTALSQADVPPSIACLHHVRRLHTSYLFRDFAEASAHAEAAGRLIAIMAGYVPSVEHNVYGSLTFAALCEDAEETQCARWMAAIAENQRRLAVWAASCPETFHHLHQLVDAEVARLEGRHHDAEDLYEQAMEGAARGGFVQHQALAAELTARHALARGRRQVADLYMQRARELYARWGASEKVRALEEELPELGRSPLIAAVKVRGLDLDLQSLLRAAATVSTEVDLDRLLEKLIQVGVQAAGAERVVLVLYEDGAPFVRASGGAVPPAVLERTPLAESSALSRAAFEQVRATRRPLVIDDASHDPRWAADPYVASHRSKSILAVPVQRQAVLVGVLHFENNVTTHAFPAARLQVLEWLSAQIAVSLENSLLFAKLTREVNERTQAEATVRFLANAGAELGASLDYAETLTKLARLAVPSLADFCTVDVVDEQRQIHRAAKAHVDPDKEPLLAQLAAETPDWDSPQPAAIVFRSGAPLLLENVTDDQIRSHARSEEHLRVALALAPRSVLAVPMEAHGRVVGVLTCALTSSARRYGPADVPVAQELGRRAALAIDNARLFLREQQAVRVREEFLSIAAHELNTPITSLRLRVQGVMRGAIPATPEAIRSTFGVIDRQVRRLTRQVDELLDVSRIRSRGLELEIARVDLASVVRDVAERMTEEAGRAGSELCVRADAPVVGQWDRARLEQVVTNLLTNAIKFGRGLPIEVAVSEGGGRALLVVRDRGIGIAPERVPRIFERFERAVSAREYGGLGLGLFIVSTIVRALGGTIRVESVQGAGSTFLVELPCEGARGEGKPRMDADRRDADDPGSGR